MKPHQLPSLLALCLLAATHASAAVRYVNVNNASPAPPYTSWSTAAKTIQDAVNAAVAGDQILVTNGVYQTGGQVAPDSGGTSNRVAVTKAVAVQSVNGPAFTVIQGYPGLGPGIRCAYLTNGASLSGFTLTNGGTGYADSAAYHNDGGGVWCQSTNSVVTNCVLVGNSANVYGGGAYGGTLNNCLLSGNSSQIGGGAVLSTLNNCVLTGNSTSGHNIISIGGGAYGCTLNNCTLSGNWANYDGGGAWGSTLNNCSLTGNSAANGGGGAYACTLNNCTLTGNSAANVGGKSAAHFGGGANGCTLNNCIAYFNVNSMAHEDNYSGCTLNYCCASPLPANGIGNISADPQLANATRLSAGSPCRGAGSAVYAAGTDIDGEAWANPPSMGCDEYHAGAVTGPLSAKITATFTNVAANYPVGLTAWIEGRSTASVWDFGDGVLETNRPYASHAWTMPGDYSVVLRAYNDSLPSGISATVAVHVLQAVHYVAANSVNPVAPYTSWTTAATNLQDAVDAATVTGALVVVTNGVYQSGGKAAPYLYALNRVAVDKLLLLRSVNGPQFTVIDGGGAIRCVYLSHGASLAGFTLTNGAGGVWCESTAVVSNCVLSGNSSGAGGGAYQGTLNNCTLTGNSVSSYGGGAFYATLNNCTLTGNSAGFSGGGAYQSTLNNCTLTGNLARFAGGGGAYESTLNNCSLTGNSAGFGGGAYQGTLNNCTLTGNSGGGVSGATLNNCIVYYNTAPGDANYDDYSTLNYCCTTPLPGFGVGNLDVEPQLASASHLSANSPCLGRGTNAAVTGVDIDGEPWANPPAMGCDEIHPGSVTGALTLTLLASYTNAATGFSVDFQALISGRVSASRWEFGDGTVVSNRPYASHAWSAAWDYPVILRAYNETYPGGVTATVTVHVVTQPVHYVAANSGNPLAPYLSWATAATNIQDAVHAAYAGGTVLVTNGTYAVGARAVDGTTNRVAVTRPLSVQSVNGPRFTVIDGAATVRCAYLINGSSLAGFTLTNGFAGDGGGVWCESTAVVSNCVLSGNSSGAGGGAYQGTLNNCTLTGNSASSYGGGASKANLNNCTLSGNSADSAGGAYRSTLNNCTLIGNSGGGAGRSSLTNCTLTGNLPSPGGAYSSSLYNCIVYFTTAEDAASDLHYCWTADPLFVDRAGANLRLQSNSPCINAGNNASAVGNTDLDGRPRIAGGTVDIGAYEFQPGVSGVFLGWLQQYGLPTDGSADSSDSDRDLMNNWQEWVAGTVPTDASSALRLLNPSNDVSGVIVSWQSVSSRTYFLERATNLGVAPPFSLLSSNLVGQAGTTSYTDTNAVGPGPFFYRVGVH